MPLIEQLGLQDARLIALCGAGGKTSLLYALGREWAIKKEKVVLTTSTHIQAELPDGCMLWDRPDEGELLSIWRAGFLPVAGRPAGRKLKSPSDEMWAIPGLSALDRPLREVCHRAELALEKGVVPDGPLTEQSLSALLLRGYGRYDPLYILNQADDGACFSRAETIRALLRGEGFEAAILSLKNLGWNR